MAGLYAYTAGLWRIAPILRAAGWDMRIGLPGPQDHVAVWGRSPLAWRGEAIARRSGASVIRIEDAFLRSIHPGRRRGAGAPLGVLIDDLGVHYDARTPSRIERLLAEDPLDDPGLIARAAAGIARLMALNLSKYNDFNEDLQAPDPGYVLVVDQTLGDASIRYGGADAATFRQMLEAARDENPGARIVVRRHPETRTGLRPGHFTTVPAGVTICDAPVSPWALIRGAAAVYAVTSQLGYEAVLAGHQPRIFGQPFYAGWGLTRDETPPPRRGRALSAAQLFAVSHIRAPVWFDPCRRRACPFEEAVDQLEAEARAFREDRHGHVATAMRLWKRRPLQQFFGRERRLIFAPPARAQGVARQTGRGILVWAGKDPGLAPARQVEDGFLRSRGLGADLVPPLSLVTDAQGIYYDPTRPSDLEDLIAAGPPPGGYDRARRLIAAIRAAGVTKYNLGGGLPDLPPGHRILVPGQVEDDASIRLGAGEICSNLALLARVRAENPDAVIIYKPHPDVEAGLRPGRIADAHRHADVIARQADPAALIAAVDEVWTMTSLLGFEALLRGTPVTVTGAPFYAGWGLTRDLGPVPARRRARPDPVALAHAALIAYPRYHDPVTRRPCPPEVAVERLASGRILHPGAGNRILAKLQGIFAGFAPLWR